VKRYALAYAATFVVMVAIDLVWLGVVAKPFYEKGIGHLLAEQPNWLAAALFYFGYPVGLVVFAIAPNASRRARRSVLISGALFGFFAYGTYDLTNLATLKNWPLGLSMIDIAWGSSVSAVSALAGWWVLRRQR
jgi:uncharacterized membrane protein